MSKYLKTYYSDSIITIILGIITYYTMADDFGSDTTYLSIQVLFILSLISFIYNNFSIIFRRRFNESNTLFPKFYLIFLITTVILFIVINNYMIIKYIHIYYYFGFIIFNYLLLSLYTNLSFEGRKKEVKKKKK